MPILLVVGLLLVGGGSLSVAADGALPGDILYPVKVNANEEVRFLFAFTEEAKARWETKRAERRLLEAEQLALKGELDVQSATALKSRFENHAEHAQGLAAKVQQEGNLVAAADARADLESVIAVHGRILAGLQSKADEETKAGIEELLPAVRARLEYAADMREIVEAQIVSAASADVKAAAEGKGRAAQNKIVEVRSFLEERASGNAKAQGQLRASAALAAEGNVFLRGEEYGKAFLKFQEAIRTAQQAKLLANVALGLPGEVRIELERARGEGAFQGEMKSEAEGSVNEETEVRIEGEIEVGL